MRGVTDMTAQEEIMAGVEIVLTGGPLVQCIAGAGRVQITAVISVQSMTSIMEHMKGVEVLTMVGTAGRIYRLQHSSLDLSKVLWSGFTIQHISREIPSH